MNILLLLMIFTFLAVYFSQWKHGDRVYRHDYDIETGEYLRLQLPLMQAYLFDDDFLTHVRIMYAWLLPYLSTLDTPIYMLDMGCGCGEMGSLIEQVDRRIRYCGVTNSRVQAELVKTRGFPVVHIDYHTISDVIPTESQDLVTFFESSGYGRWDKLSAQVHRVLKPGSFLFVKDFFAEGQSFHDPKWNYWFRSTKHVEEECARNGLQLVWKRQFPADLKHYRLYYEFMKQSKLMREFHGSMSVGKPNRCWVMIFRKL